MNGPVLTPGTPALPRMDVGWPLLAVPDENGALAWPDAARSVRQMIEVILRTAPGEQLMQPEFGAGLENLIHAPNTLTTRAEAHDAILASIRRYEPRVLLDSVDVAEGADPRELVITLSFRLTLTDEPMEIQARVPVGVA